VKKEEDRAVIDSNLLIRFLTEDDPEKAKAVEILLGKIYLVASGTLLIGVIRGT
jgi:hypothetical protein